MTGHFSHAYETLTSGPEILLKRPESRVLGAYGGSERVSLKDHRIVLTDGTIERGILHAERGRDQAVLILPHRPHIGDQVVHHLELRLDPRHLLGELGTALHDDTEVFVAGDALRLLDRLEIGLHAPQLLADEGDTLIDKVILSLCCRILVDGAHTIVDLYQLGEEVLALVAVVSEDGE